MTLQELYHYDAVENRLLHQRNYRESETPMVAPETIVGLELEIEGWLHEEPQLRGFTFETDGSLRNNGIEAITRPTRLKYVPELLKKFFNTFEVSDKNYSERCSIHVHVNCQNFTISQVQSLAALYQMFEGLLFAFVGADRSNNIFCVPWSQCLLPLDMASSIASDPEHKIRNWEKYTALNLIPLRTQGTVEFRHMHGSCDVEKITNWLNIICSLHSYAMLHSKEELYYMINTLNTSSEYEVFINDVFGNYAELIRDIPFYSYHLSQGVTDAKLACLNDLDPSEKPPKQASVPDWGAIFQNLPAAPERRPTVEA